MMSLAQAQRMASKSLSRLQKIQLYLESFLTLAAVWLGLRTLGMVIVGKFKLPFSLCPSVGVEQIYRVVWNTSQVLPLHCRCLEVAMAVRILSYLHGNPTKVIIGIQTMPFLSHAWVEWGGNTFGAADDHSFTTVTIFD